MMWVQRRLTHFLPWHRVSDAHNEFARSSTHYFVMHIEVMGQLLRLSQESLQGHALLVETPIGQLNIASELTSTPEFLKSF